MHRSSWSRPLPWAALLGALATAGCGKRGDPLPPLPSTPQAIALLRLSQRGDHLEIKLVTPRSTAGGARLGLLDIEFLTADVPGDLRKVGRKSREKAAPGETLVIERPLLPPGTILRVQARALHHGDSSAPTPETILRTEKPVPAPADLAAHQDPAGVTLTWRAPEPMPRRVVPPPAPSPSPTPRLPTFGFLSSPKPSPGTPSPTTTPAPSASPSPAGPSVGTPAATPAPSPSPSPGGPSMGTTPATLAASASPSPAAPSPGTAAAPPAPSASPSPPAGMAGAVTPVLSPGPTPGPGASPSPQAPGGFFVYRRAANGSYVLPLAPLLSEPRFVDKAVAPGDEVCYSVRTAISSEPVIESAGSGEACLKVRDVTPPDPPKGLATLPGPGGIQISWSPSPEEDLASYRVYRAAGGSPPALLAEVPRGQTAYRDASAEPGVTYRYTLTAVDASGNESPPSSPASGRRP